MMLHARIALVGLPAACLLLAPLSPAAQRATPVLQAFQQLADPRGGPAVHVLVEPDRGVSWRLGMAFQCRAGARPVIAIYLGPFPPDARPTQLAVRTPSGAVERFGRPVAAGPEYGFNDIQLADAGRQRRFARAALQPRSLISNGYNSFWNAASAADNRAVFDELVACGL